MTTLYPPDHAYILASSALILGLCCLWLLLRLEKACKNLLKGYNATATAINHLACSRKVEHPMCGCYPTYATEDFNTEADTKRIAKNLKRIVHPVFAKMKTGKEILTPDDSGITWTLPFVADGLDLEAAKERIAQRYPSFAAGQDKAAED